MGPLAQQPLRQLRVLPAGPYEVAQGSEHGVPELIAHGQQRRRSRGQSHPLSLQLFQRFAPGGDLRQRFLGLAPLGAEERLALPRLRHQVAPALGVTRRALGLVGPERGLLDGVIATPLSDVKLVLEPFPMGPGLRGPVAQRGQLAFQRSPLALERPQLLGACLECFLLAPDQSAPSGTASGCRRR